MPEKFNRSRIPGLLYRLASFKNPPQIQLPSVVKMIFLEMFRYCSDASQVFYD